jgi:hypothetical protein
MYANTYLYSTNLDLLGLLSVVHNVEIGNRYSMCQSCIIVTVVGRGRPRLRFRVDLTAYI